MTAEDRAARAADAMWQGDAASAWFGMERVAVSEGAATLRMTVAPHHCNGHGTCHGGVIFSLADSAFAFACNSRNQATVAQAAQVSFLAPGRAADVLTATAREVSLKGRSGLYDVTVTRADGDVIAEFRGMSRAIPGQLFEETT
ncbi:hydroxyphenylacetyl-CoA thioesterase PaaI [uncultured Jannaschia sp.]|uniref:hydroxyphenylacetyl-CoA thioesterase PaaI n=1 Tax=uncultured Jannaschia sp. TaxID=293347 RepID=UPI00261908D5|nr:hydroxyphenylacetyl-CoA thioesterase PaaI [uncultured Jannaschia sp.]